MKSRFLLKLLLNCPNIRCRTLCIILSSILCNNTIKCRRPNNNIWCLLRKISTNILSTCNQCKFRLFLHRCLRYTIITLSLIYRVMRIRLIVREGVRWICNIFSRIWLRSFRRWTSVIRMRTKLMRYQIWVHKRAILPSLFSNQTRQIMSRFKMLMLMKKAGLIIFTKCSSGMSRTLIWISCRAMSSSVARIRNVLGLFKNAWS